MEHKKLKIDKKRKPEVMAIVLLIFSLTIILIVLSQVKNYLPEEAPIVPQLQNGQKVGVLDSLYLNFHHYFSWKKPSPEWEFDVLDTTLHSSIVDTLAPVLPQIKWLVAMQNGGEAESQIGILNWPKKIQSKDVIATILAELIQQYETGNQKLRIVVPMETPAHRILQGAFTVVELPGSSAVEKPLWIISLLPRDKTGYIIISKTTEEKFPQLKVDLEKCVSYFSAVSKTIFD